MRDEATNRVNGSAEAGVTARADGIFQAGGIAQTGDIARAIGDAEATGSLHVVLFEPEIPQNTGNIARTCVVVGATLHLVDPLGFRLTERNLKRSGCDYWDDVRVVRHVSTERFLAEHATDRLVFFTAHTQRRYTDVDLSLDAGDLYLIFGRESRGIDPAILRDHPGSCVRIPMREGMRSLNLSNAVAIAAYECVRQSDILS